MTVLYATQVLSNSVASSIEAIAGHEKMKMFQTSELIKFIRLMNRFFDCMNGKETSGEEATSERQEEENRAQDEENEKTVHDKAPYTKLDDPRFDFLHNDFLSYFSEWKNDIDSRPGLFSDNEKNRMIISHQSLGALETTVHGVAGAIRFMIAAGAPSVNARVFNQDPLEQRAQGDNRNPSLKTFQDVRLNLHAQGLVASSSQKGNTEVQKRKGIIEIDSSNLPVRKSLRK
ncbi:Succinate--CoA ligase [ADP-forming] subunit beta [Frankliniella fusca]|uniref:Succinate--CoA ligase [ADP-forming] subunit beta n=1 Tax=Frankliniella fusca TaxID=407009 RepID=A0AAE1I242_9NEOP|nr:Succinate--CoA ligase [ADP-forming] subunit beta [Frankliniella fusca]